MFNHADFCTPLQVQPTASRSRVPDKYAARDAARIKEDDHATSREKACAQQVIDCHQHGWPISSHVVEVLGGYISRRQRVNRYGQ